MQKWIEYNLENPEMWDQKTLQYVIYDMIVPQLEVFQIPGSYYKVFDEMEDAGEPVIEHFQLSRKANVPPDAQKL